MEGHGLALGEVYMERLQRDIPGSMGSLSPVTSSASNGQPAGVRYAGYGSQSAASFLDQQLVDSLNGRRTSSMTLDLLTTPHDRTCLSLSPATTGTLNPHFSSDLSEMPDEPPRPTGHRRAQSDIDVRFQTGDELLMQTGEASLPSNDAGEDLFSLYMDMDKLNYHTTSSPGAPQVGTSEGLHHVLSAIANGHANAGHHRSLSMDALAQFQLSRNSASASPLSDNARRGRGASRSMDFGENGRVKQENGEIEGDESLRKAVSSSRLADVALTDPKRAKRILANRQSAARSKERKMRYISELERRVQSLQTDATTLAAHLSMLQRDTSDLGNENNELKVRLQAMEQQAQQRDALSEALKEELQRLKVATGQSQSSAELHQLRQLQQSCSQHNALQGFGQVPSAAQPQQQEYSFFPNNLLGL